MTNTVLTDEQKAKFVSDICEYGTDFVVPLYSVVDAIEQAVLQSNTIRALLAERDELAAKIASYERAERDICETLNMGNGSYQP